MGPAELDRRVLLSYEEEPGRVRRRWLAGLGRSQGLQVAAVLVTVQVIFGGYAIVVKVAMREHADALVFSLYRDIGASVVLLGACTLMGERKPVLPGDRMLFLGVGPHCTLHTHGAHTAHTRYARGTHTTHTHTAHTRGVGPQLCVSASSFYTLSLFGLGVGLCGVTITQTALVLALQYVPAFNASLMQPSQPVLTLLLALCLRLEALRST